MATQGRSTFPLDGGLVTDVVDHRVEPGQFTVLEEARHPTSAVGVLERRPGHQTESSSVSGTSVGVITVREQPWLLHTKGASLFSGSGAIRVIPNISGSGSYNATAPVYGQVTDGRAFRRNDAYSQFVTSPQYVRGSSGCAVAWLEASTAGNLTWYARTMTADGNVLDTLVLSATTYDAVRLLHCTLNSTPTAVLFYVYTSGGNRYYRYRTAALDGLSSWSAETTITSAAVAALIAAPEVCTHPRLSSLWVADYDTGTALPRLRQVNLATALTTWTTNSPGVGGTASDVYAVAASASHVVMLFNQVGVNNAGMFACAISNGAVTRDSGAFGPTGAVADFDVMTLATYDDSTGFWAWGSCGNAALGAATAPATVVYELSYQQLNATTGTTGVAGVTWHAQIIGHAAYTGTSTTGDGIAVVPLAYWPRAYDATSNRQGFNTATNVTVDEPAIELATCHQIDAAVAKLSYVGRLGVDRYSGLYCYLNPDGKGSIHAAYASDAARATYGNGQVIRAASVQYTLGDSTVGWLPAPQYAEDVAGATYAAGAFPRYYDSWATAEVSPLYRPRLRCADNVAGANLFAAGGTYYLRAVYIWRDGAGNVHRSAPSDLYTHTIGGANAAIDVSVIYPLSDFNPSAAAGTGELGVEIFCSPTAGATAITQVLAAGGSYPIATTFVTGEMQCTIRTTNVSTSYPALYSTGADGEELLPKSPPPARSVERVGDRLWLLDGETGEIWPSKQRTSGIAWEWSDLLKLVLPTNEAPTAIVEWGGKPLVFTRSECWAILGDGVTNAGAGPTFAMQRVADVGLIAPRMSARTTDKLIVRDLTGWWAIDKGFGVQPFAQEVASQLSNVRTVTHTPATREVRFAATSLGCWVYQYQRGAWSKVASNYGTNGEACSRGGKLFAAQSSRLRWDYTNTANNTASIIAQTGWLRPGGTSADVTIQEFFVELEHLMASGTLRIRAYRNGDSATVYDQTFTHAEMAAARYGTGNLAQLRCVLTSPVAHALKIRFDESVSIGTSNKWLSVTLVYTVGREWRELQATR